MAYGDKEGLMQGYSQAAGMEGEDIANKAFELMTKGNQELNIFEESGGARYINMIKNNLNLTGKDNNEEDNYSLAADKRNWDDGPHIPIEEAFGVHNWPGLEFTPENVADGRYYHKVRQAIEGEPVGNTSASKANLIASFVRSKDFQDVSDKNKEKYYNILDGIKIAEGISKMRHSAESDIFHMEDGGGEYFKYKKLDGDIKETDTATLEHIDRWKNKVFKKDSKGRVLNEFKEDFSVRRSAGTSSQSFYEKARQNNDIEAIEFINEVRQAIEGGRE
jgi:hypothetical protein